MSGGLSRLPRLVGVVGGGQMGSGIAQVAATYGAQVILCDSNQAALQKSEDSVYRSLTRLISKDLMAESDAEAVASRISRVTDLQALEASEFIVEAVSEQEELKTSILQTLDQHVSTNCILATNTSSISITRLAAATSRPDRVIGMHWMNPPPVMRLIEVIRGMQTSDKTYEVTTEFSTHMGKTVTSSADRPGFVVNRILMPMINEAFYALMEGVASAEDIDRGMKLGTNQPMGPLALADMIGLDTCLSIMRVLHEGLGDTKYRPCPLLIQYVDAGLHGRKTGQGVHKYDT